MNHPHNKPDLIGNTVYNYFYDCPLVPKHLSHKISQEAWDWINTVSSMFRYKQRYYHPNGMEFWQIRGYWLIGYFMNPSQENLDFMIKNLFEYGMLDKDNNLEYLEFRYELDTMLKSVKKEIQL